MVRGHHWWFVCSSSCLLLKAGGGVGPPKVTSSSPTWTSPPPSPASCSPAGGLLGKQDPCLLISYFFLQLNRGINLWSTLILQTTECGICNSTTNFTDWCNYPPQLLPRQKHPRGAERAITSSEIKRPVESKSVSHRERHRGPDVAVLASLSHHHLGTHLTNLRTRPSTNSFVGTNYWQLTKHLNEIN